MDLNTVTDLRTAPDLPPWQPGDLWLAGGTWLFSEPQVGVRRLLDITTLGWPALSPADDGLEIAATCTIHELHALVPMLSWPAAPLIIQCCRSLVASHKIQNVATVGGNLCNALPAGAMISLTAALDGVCTLWATDGGIRQLSVLDFVVGDNRNALEPGELLRSIHLPATALACRTAFRQGSLTAIGRSAALLIGRRDSVTGGFVLTITASVVRPVQLAFAGVPGAQELCRAVEDAVPAELLHADVHGDPAWRRHLTLHFAEEIRQELLAGERP